ncbi:MAG: hypothetical protein NTY23_02865 [Chloroflexi bacterium]|nr:hypothetical protein [Chloroflexota bacterium]
MWRRRANTSLGGRLLAQAMEYLRGRGAQATYLDGVPRAIPLCERAGFRMLYRSLRFRGSPRPRTIPAIRAMDESDLGQVLRLDRDAFDADRSFFLTGRWTAQPSLCPVERDAGRPTGYLFARLGRGVAAAGPWYARDPQAASPALLGALAEAANGLPLAVGVLEANRRAAEVALEGGLREQPDPPSRMRAGTDVTPSAQDQLLGIGSPAKG